MNSDLFVVVGAVVTVLQMVASVFISDVPADFSAHGFQGLFLDAVEFFTGGKF